MNYAQSMKSVSRKAGKALDKYKPLIYPAS